MLTFKIKCDIMFIVRKYGAAWFRQTNDAHVDAGEL